VTTDTARANQASGEVEPIIGVPSPEVGDLLGDMTIDVDELDTSSLSNCNVKIIGFDYQPGGEEREVEDANEPSGKRTWITQDTLVMWQEVEDIEGIDTTRQFFPLPKTYTADDGSVRRRKANENSKWGIWLSVLGGLGIAGNAEQGTRLRFQRPEDLIGLRYHKEEVPYEGPRNSTIKVDVPVEILGFDHAFRKTVKGSDGKALKAVTFDGESG
jgi:hypothetical protein